MTATASPPLRRVQCAWHRTVCVAQDGMCLRVATIRIVLEPGAGNLPAVAEARGCIATDQAGKAVGSKPRPTVARFEQGLEMSPRIRRPRARRKVEELDKLPESLVDLQPCRQMGMREQLGIRGRQPCRNRSQILGRQV